MQQKNDKFLEHLGDTNDETCRSVWLGVERERDEGRKARREGKENIDIRQLELSHLFSPLH